MASHMAALPASFLNPGTSLGVTLIISMSVLQCRAGVYISQKAVLAVTGCGGPAGGFAVLDSSVTGALVFSRQPARSSIATTALTENFLNAAPIGILHVLEWLRSGLGDVPNGFLRLRKRPDVRHGLT